MKMQHRKQLLKSSIFLSRTTFSILVILLCLTPSLKEGLFPPLQFSTLSFAGRNIPIGVEFLLACLILVGSLGSWFFSARCVKVRFGGWQTTVPILGFGLVTIIRSWPIHEPQVALIAVLSIIMFWAIYFYVLQFLPIRWIITILAIIFLIQGIFGILQFIYQRSLNLPFTRELVLDPSVRGIGVIEAEGRRWLRAYGLTPHPNFLGGYIGLGLLLFGGSLVENPRQFWLWLIVAISGCAFLLTFSRSAWLGFALSVLFCLLVLRPWQHIKQAIHRTHRQLLVSLIIVFLLVSAFGVVFRDLLVTRFLRFEQTLEANSIQERLRDAGQAWMLIRHQPMWGVGTGYYVQALWAWANTTGRDFPAFQPVHNIPLLVTAEMGVFGFVFWVWLLLGPPLRLIVERAIHVTPFIVTWAAAFLLLFVVSMFDQYLYIPKVWWSTIYLGLLLGGWERVTRTQGVVGGGFN